ncbi:MAG TPA: twin-arginine translocase TatA/TatE family subunit [Anaerolineae bacterium]|nr:twin-arginine translocase TatA/TatE family subunit [Anaerolineae bacterium]
MPGLGSIGLPELLIVLVIIIIIFGVGKLPEIGGALGKGIREFRAAQQSPAEGDSKKAEAKEETKEEEKES